MTRHISKEDAQEEAIRIASTLVSANVPKDSLMTWQCVGASPDELSAGSRRGKTAVKWVVVFHWLTSDGSTVDGDSIVHVNLETKEAYIKEE